MDLRPIGAYGLIGDTRTAALVDDRGSLDWLCLPHFDGEPVFARLVAGEGGGRFLLGPARAARLVRRRYRDESTVLETEWRVRGSRVRLTESMITEVEGRLFPTCCVVRRIETDGSPARIALCFDPRFGLGRRPLRLRSTRAGLICSSGSLALSLSNDADLSIDPGRLHEFDLEPGRALTLVLTAEDAGPVVHLPSGEAWHAVDRDEKAWRDWSGQIEFEGQLAAPVRQSLRVLRLLTYSPSGAPVAAPTTSLPERIGGEHNWDYRFAWPRDASIGIGAFLGVGREDAARAFLYWLLHASRLDRPRLAPLLTIHGRPVPREREAPGWPGYHRSAPVRFGNAASGQHQLDNYGWVLDAMWLLVRDGHGLFPEAWRAGSRMADLVASRWREPDSGLWEVRGEPRHYVHSKLMAWLALDRALCVARKHRTRQSRIARWTRAREAIAADVVRNGFDDERSTFVRAYGRSDLDAATLLLPVIGMEPPDSPRTRGTIDAISRELSAGGPLLYRYLREDEADAEGAFLPCAFWLVQALAATGRVDEATDRFEQLLSFGGGLGLFSEEADPATGAALGNYPQALTHAALVQAALAIRDATSATRAGGGPTPRRTPGARAASPPASPARS